jgi:hypothetical protein
VNEEVLPQSFRRESVDVIISRSRRSSVHVRRSTSPRAGDVSGDRQRETCRVLDVTDRERHAFDVGDVDRVARRRVIPPERGLRDDSARELVTSSTARANSCTRVHDSP